MSEIQNTSGVPRLGLDGLRPFVSLLLVKAPENRDGDALFQDVLHGCSSLVHADDERKRRGLAAEPKLDRVETVEFGALLIEEAVRPAWTIQPDISDLRYHVIVLARLGNLFAFHSSDSGILRKIALEIGRNHVPGFGELSRIDPSLMNAAFVQGTTRTVWLRGIHRPTSLKSDTKMLSGRDLDDALNPLDDQSYHFTAVRSQFADGVEEFTIGTAPSESRIWIRRASNWEAFKAATITALTRIAETHDPSHAPIRFLALPGAGGRDVSHAFDMGLYPSEMMDAANEIDDEREQRERIASELSFEVIPQDGPNLTAVVRRGKYRIGSVSLRFGIEDEHVTCNAQVIADQSGDADVMVQVQRYCEQGDMLIVRYDSEHVISSGTLYRYRYRDHTFGGYEWADLQDYDIVHEKPSALTEIGNEQSLFCWAWWKWSGGLDEEFGGGWLACDDGAGEKADFIHFNEETRTLSLIHIKASDSESDRRSVAVARYEVVVSQAIKNLRFLDRDNLREGLLSRLNGASNTTLSWCSGTACTREAFIAALERIDARCKRQVVIVQPHLRFDVFQRASADPDSQDGRRLRQLNTLLVGAEASCRAMGAKLTVIGAR